MQDKVCKGEVQIHNTSNSYAIKQFGLMVFYAIT